MRYSIFSVQDHYPGGARTVPEFYAETIAMAEAAERLGYDTVFLAEHHFHEYGVIPDPAVMLAALAQRTRRIRLGTAISNLVFRHPATVAESYAMVDVLSGGRLVLGVGSGYLKHEFAGFQIPPEEKRQRFDEALGLVRRLLAGERVSHAGQFFKLEEVALNLRPLQQPTPPIYIAILSKEGAYFIGRQGSRLQTVPYASLTSLAQVAELEAEYRRGLAEGGHVGMDDDVVHMFHCHVAETDAAARRGAAEAFELYVETRLYAYKRRYDDVLASGLGLFGSVETVAETLVALHGMGVRHVSLLQNFGNLAHERMLRSMRLFAEEVMPRVRRRIAKEVSA
ncbi:MAG TPA: LLM class flavin-dependent oxidoreductase [Stellaceae bacterium]|nr:LLM class flavin-dependent oxidoreductase [Stellaceae bacterium]